MMALIAGLIRSATSTAACTRSTAVASPRRTRSAWAVASSAVKSVPIRDRTLVTGTRERLGAEGVEVAAHGARRYAGRSRLNDFERDRRVLPFRGARHRRRGDRAPQGGDGQHPA